MLPVLTNNELIRFFEKIKPQGDCLVWVASTVKGYGHVNIRGTTYLSHRLMYNMCKGRPSGVVHHICANKLCVKPSHLETMSTPEHTILEIAMNGSSNIASNRTTCKNGHPWVDLYININGRAVCKTCRSINVQKSKQREEYKVSRRVKRSQKC